MTAFEKYLAHLEAIFQVKPEIFTEKSLLEGESDIIGIVYRNVPEPGMVTGLTYGLSTVDHPDWKFGRPELCISVNSEDISWGKVVAFLANQMRSKFNFAYGSTIRFGVPVADDSAMDAFLIFAPSILDKSDYLDINIGLDYKIHMAGVYPIYDSEIEAYRIMGLEKFWTHPNFDLYDLNRKVVSE